MIPVVLSVAGHSNLPSQSIDDLSAADRPGVLTHSQMVTASPDQPVDPATNHRAESNPVVFKA